MTKSTQQLVDPALLDLSSKSQDFLVGLRYPESIVGPACRAPERGLHVQCACLWRPGGSWPRGQDLWPPSTRLSPSTAQGISLSW